MELPKQLKANRERLGLSQEDVCHAIYVSRQTMSSWENGKTYPDVQSLLLLSDLFGVSVDDLVKGDVDSMKDIVIRDAVEMERASWGAVCSTIIAVVCMACCIKIWPSPSFIPHISCGTLIGIALFIGLLALALFFAHRIERIKKDHNLVTYREISDFMDGEEYLPDESGLGRARPWLSNLIKLACGAGAGLFIAFVITLLLDALSR